MNIDRGIKNTMRTKSTPEALRYQRIYKKIKRIRIFFILFLFALTFFEKPEWCLKNPNVANTVTCDNDAREYPNSDLPKLEPLVTKILNLICMPVFMFFTLLKKSFKNPSKDSKRMEIL